MSAPKLTPFADLVPTNWCDALLTGTEGIGPPPYDCRHIERLLLAVKERISKAERGLARPAGGRR